MTTLEFSDLFDVLYNNITSNLAPGLNEYEKSVFLTKAQDKIVKQYFLAFDADTQKQADFSMLMRQAELSVLSGDIIKYDPRATVFVMPEPSMPTEDSLLDEVFILINESVQIIKNEEIDGHTVRKLLGIRLVLPISFIEYNLKMSKPYKEPLKYQAWRFLEGKWNVDSQFRTVQVILNSPDRTLVESDETIYPLYVIRYIKRPDPIVLDLGSEPGVSINGVDTETLCELDPILHQEILDEAVNLAKIAWVGLQQPQQQRAQLL